MHLFSLLLWDCNSVYRESCETNSMYGIYSSPASGVMRFQRTHPILEEFLRELISSFDGSDWGSNGPILLSNVIRRICNNADSLHGLSPDQCLGLVLFPKTKFYPLHWTKWERLFDPNYADWVMETVAESTAVHLWGKQSQGHTLKASDEDHGASRLAKENCPLTWGHGAGGS